eukprot:scaffold36267_cov58-Phaeocystis_antarctica.AAC.1
MPLRCAHDHSARPRAPQTHATPSSSTYAPRDRDLVRCILCCLAVRVVRGGRKARPDQAASREARPEPAGPLSHRSLSLPEPLPWRPPHPSLSSHRMLSAPQVIRPRLTKWLAAFCMLECVGAATSPSSPAPKFGAATIDGGEGPGLGEASPADGGQPHRDFVDHAVGKGALAEVAPHHQRLAVLLASSVAPTTPCVDIKPTSWCSDRFNKCATKNN